MPHNDNGQHFPGVWRLVKRCDQNLKEALVLADQLIRLADQGDQDREDTGCGILYGMVRDAGYKIRQVAEDEKKKHIAKGWWDRQQS